MLPLERVAGCLDSEGNLPSYSSADGTVQGLTMIDADGPDGQSHPLQLHQKRLFLLFVLCLNFVGGHDTAVLIP